MSYTREQFLQMLEDAASDMSLFYRDKRINYRGRTADTGEYFTEVAAEWLLANLHRLGEIKSVTRKYSYKVAGHDGVPDNPDSGRDEELIAMAMKQQGDLPLVGRVIDYQTPLKSGKEDHAGKIDLLAYDGETLRILELKKPDSKETMLRCVLEGYTYLKTADTRKLLADFGLPDGTKVRACPFVFYEGAQWQEMQQHRPHLKRLMQTLGSKPFYITKNNNLYTVTED